MPTTYEQRETIWRLRTFHDISPKVISTLFPTIPYSSIRRITSTFSPQAATTEDRVKHNKQSVEISDSNVTYERVQEIKTGPTTATDRVKTLEDLISSANIDTDKWQIERWIANTWENAMKGPDFTPIITTLYQVRAFLKPSEQALVNCLIEEVRREIRDGFDPVKPSPAIKQNLTGYLLELSIPDMHFGKLALLLETGEEYNLDIAEDIYRKAINQLTTTTLQSGYGIDRILMPLGNDLFHVDNAYLTTFNNTQMESVHSVKQLFRRVKNILRDVIIELNEYAPVEIIMIPGNHDPTISYFLAEALEDMFWNSETITVINSPKVRQYCKWGNALIGFTHGDRIKHDQLPMLMVEENKFTYAITQYHEWHLGHKHRPKITKFQPLSMHNGVIIRELPSLSAAGNWDYQHGFTLGERSADAYLWHDETGLKATYHVDLKSLA